MTFVNSEDVWIVSSKNVCGVGLGWINCGHIAGRALTQTHKAHVVRHMGGIRGRKGRKKDRIYERVCRRVCLSAPLTAPLPALSLTASLFITPNCLSDSSLFTCTILLSFSLLHTKLYLKKIYIFFNCR